MEPMRTARREPQHEPDAQPAAEYRPKTELGRRLWELRQRVMAVEKPLEWDEIEQELAARRGERTGR